MAKTSILISGAGIAGPTLAYWLRARGFEPVLIERAPRFREGGYLIDFWGVGFDVAERMALVPVLRDRGYVIDQLRFVTDDGTTRSELGGDTIRRAVGDRFVSIARGDLARAIYDLVEDKVEVMFGDSIRSLHEDEAGVEVTFDHAPGRRFDLVIGCDGLHSKVRAASFGPEAQFERYLGYVTASFMTTGYPHRDEHTYLSYPAPGRQIARYALRDDRTVFFLVCARTDRPLIDPHDTAAQQRLLTEAFAADRWHELPAILERLATCEDLYFDSVSQIEMPAWSRGRVALIGDAAYCPSLLAGQGTAFAMAGAYILAGELERAGGDHHAAFAAYERAFRPFIERKQKAARKFAGSFVPRTRLGIFARNQALRLMSVPWLGNWMMRRMLVDDCVLPEYSP